MGGSIIQKAAKNPTLREATVNPFARAAFQENSKRIIMARKDSVTYDPKTRALTIPESEHFEVIKLTLTSEIARSFPDLLLRFGANLLRDKFSVDERMDEFDPDEDISNTREVFKQNIRAAGLSKRTKARRSKRAFKKRRKNRKSAFPALLRIDSTVAF